MSETTFQRARTPEAQQQRRDALLVAAGALFDEAGAAGAGLNAIAARAGFTKSNVYRYFESREQVLIELLHEAIDTFLPRIEAEIAGCAEGDRAAVAAAGTRAFLAVPRFPQLLAILATTLEQNVSVDTLIAMKRHLMDMVQRIGGSIQDRLPGARLEDCIWVAATVGTFIAGLWPNTHPSAAAREVLAMPEFSALRPSLERDLERLMLALLESV